MRCLTVCLIALYIAAIAGCAADAAAPPPGNTGRPQPIGVQIMQASPDLKGQRFTNLLHFEVPSDSVFISATGLRVTRDSSRAHTGQASIRAAGAGRVSVKLASLLGGRAFPDDWTLGGAYFYCEHPTRITVTCEIGGKVFARNQVDLPPRQWAAAMVDLANPADGARALSGAPTLSFDLDAAGDVWCDDVLLINNSHWIIGNDESKAGWRIRMRGYRYVVESAGVFLTRLTTAEAAPAGWRVEEANPFRVRFSSDGPNKSLTIYPDGRSYLDGRFNALAPAVRAEPLHARQPDAPAEIRIPETMGRVDRRTSGDANNDGYNEARGAYTLIADGPRFEATLVPQSVPLIDPILEISGFPPGKALVTVEGRLVQNVLRREDGTLLVGLTGRIDRPTTMNIGLWQ